MPISRGGLGDELATGPQLTAWFAHLVTDWGGDDAFLRRLSVDIEKLPVLGSTTFLDGEVEGCTRVGEHAFTSLRLWATDQDEGLVATGNALVALASTQSGPVGLPFRDDGELP